MNILFLILFLIFLLFGLATTIPPIFDKKYKYEECPVENSACGNVVNLVKYVSNCVGIVLCYKGLAKEPGLLYYIKSQQTTDVSLGQNNRICKNCINTGQCKEFENGVKVEWNGFKLYSYKNKQTLELIMDLYGNSYSQNFTETTPLEFFQYFGYGNKQNSQFKQNESPKFSSALIFLDLSFLNDTYNPLREGGRSVYIGLHGSGEECKEETTTVTTPTSTSTTKFLTTEKSTTTKKTTLSTSISTSTTKIPTTKKSTTTKVTTTKPTTITTPSTTKLLTTEKGTTTTRKTTTPTTTVKLTKMEKTNTPTTSTTKLLTTSTIIKKISTNAPTTLPSKTTLIKTSESTITTTKIPTTIFSTTMKNKTTNLTTTTFSNPSLTTNSTLMETIPTKATTTLASKTPLIEFNCTSQNISTLYEEYSCKCGNMNFFDINKCCENYQYCIWKVNNIKCIENKTCTKEELCYCDSQVAQCWIKLPKPIENDICYSKLINEIKLNASSVNNLINILITTRYQTIFFKEPIVEFLVNIKNNKTIDKIAAKISTEKAADLVNTGVKLISKIDENMNYTISVAFIKAKIAFKIINETKNIDNKVKQQFEVDLINFEYIMNAAPIYENEAQMTDFEIEKVHILALDLIDKID